MDEKRMNFRIPPLALTALFIVLMTYLSWLFPSYTFSFSLNNLLAIFVVTVGGIFSIMGVMSFRKAKTTVNPNKPDDVSALVTSGIYSLSRNPMYVGFLFFQIGWGLFLSHWLALIFLPPVFVACMNKYQIPDEEKSLEALFGEEFILYKNKVRRWL